MRELVIRGSEWLRGAPSCGVLRNAGTGEMCCLGILGRECGIPVEKMEGIGLPMWPEVVDDGRWPFSLLREDAHPETDLEARLNLEVASVIQEVADINDNDHRTDEERIAALASYFADWGFTLVWRPDE